MLQFLEHLNIASHVDGSHLWQKINQYAFQKSVPIALSYALLEMLCDAIPCSTVLFLGQMMKPALVTIIMLNRKSLLLIARH
jgi:hypothetical protein